jgi:hypothetical protein
MVAEIYNWFVAEIYNWFTERFDIADLKDARSARRVKSVGTLFPSATA